MGVGVVPQSYQTTEYQILECGRTAASPAEKFAILLEAGVANTSLGSTSSKIDILKREVKAQNGYARRRIARIVTAIASGVFTCAGHGLSNGQTVFIAGSNPGSTYNPPSGTALGTAYFVINATSDNFSVAATSGGSAISTSLPAGTTVIIPGGSYDGVDRRHESMVETVRFQGQSTGYTYGGLAVIRGGAANANVIVSNFNDASEQITISSGHGLSSGDEIFFTQDAGATMPTGLSALTSYFARVVSATVITVHPTRAEAIANTNVVAFSTTGSGAIWLHYANGEVAGWETFTTAATLANGEEQPFTFYRYHMNSGNSLGLA